MTGKLFKFTSEDLAKFSRASGDENDLHMNAGYASRSVFGRQVVFGVAILLRALTEFTRTAGPVRLANLKCEFKKPLLLEQVCTIEFDQEANKVICLVRSEGEVVCKFSFAYELLGDGVNRLNSENTRANILNTGLQTNDQVHDKRHNYSLANLSQLSELYGWMALPLPASQIGFLLWTSYWVGMIYPGRQALYSQLECKNFPTEINQVEVTSAIKDERFALSRIDGRFLNSGVTEIVSEDKFRIVALHRPEPIETRVSQNDRKVEWAEFEGRRAIVIGGSRGFGATVAKLLALHGCNVDIVYGRNQMAAESVRNEIAAFGVKCELAKIDLTSESDVRQSKIKGREPYDLVFINAMPFIEKKNYTRYEPGEFVRKFSEELSLNLHSLDLAKSWLKVDGMIVYSSSEYVTAAPAGFSRYCALKAAVEKVIATICNEEKSMCALSFRLPKMLTDQTNNPMDFAVGADTKQIAFKVIAEVAMRVRSSVDASGDAKERGFSTIELAGDDA